MDISREAPHPMIEPLDYQLTPEAAAEQLSGDPLSLYSLVWRGALATMVEGPAFVRTVIDIVVGAPSGEAGKADLRLRINGLERIMTDAHDPSWAALLPGEDLAGARREGLVGGGLPATLRDGLGELGSGRLDALGWRSHDEAQCRQIEALLSPLDQWHSHALRQNEPYGFDRLVEDMACQGVGRPSTYASTLESALENGLIRLVDGSLEVAERGRLLLERLSGADSGDKPGFERLDAAFSSDLAVALDAIEADPASAGQVLSVFSRRAIGFEATALAAWLDALEIEGETLAEAIARAERTLPPATSWAGALLPSGLVPTLLCEQPGLLAELRRRCDELLAAADIPAWKALSDRQRAARRLRVLLADAGPAADWVGRAARDLVLRWWIDLAPAERPLTYAEVMQDPECADELRDLAAQVLVLLAPAGEVRP